MKKRDKESAKNLQKYKIENAQDVVSMIKRTLYDLEKGKIDHKKANSIISGAIKLNKILEAKEAKKIGNLKDEYEDFTDEEIEQELEYKFKKSIGKMKKKDLLAIWNIENKKRSKP